jgi:hypothetical protein
MLFNELCFDAADGDVADLEEKQRLGVAKPEGGSDQGPETLANRFVAPAQANIPFCDIRIAATGPGEYPNRMFNGEVLILFCS